MNRRIIQYTEGQIFEQNMLNLIGFALFICEV